MRLHFLIATALLLTGSAYGDNVYLRELPNSEGTWQEARGLVNAPPERVRAWLTDFRGWPHTFGDVQSMEILRQDGNFAVLRFRSRIFERRLVLHVEARPNGIRFFSRDGSVYTEGKVWLSDAGSGCTDVIIQNAAHVGGFIGAFVPQRVIRDRQRAKLRADLTSLQQMASSAFTRSRYHAD